jgi:hypothetical protein
MSPLTSLLFLRHEPTNQSTFLTAIFQEQLLH